MPLKFLASRLGRERSFALSWLKCSRYSIPNLYSVDDGSLLEPLDFNVRITTDNCMF